METLPPLGRRVWFGRVNPPQTGNPDYRQWIPVPSALPDEHGYGNMIYTIPNALVSNVDDEYDEANITGVPRMTKIARVKKERGGPMGDDVVGNPKRLGSFSFAGNFIRGRIDYFGIGYRNYNGAVRFGNSTVLFGDIDTESVVDTISETRYESAGSYEGYDLFDRYDPPRTVGVGESALVFSKGKEGGDAIRSIVDTSEGRVSRYHEEYDDFGEITDNAGSAPFVFFGMSGDFEPGEPSRKASSFNYDNSGVYHTLYFVYPDGKVPPEAEIKDAAEEHAQEIRSGSVDIKMGERTVTVEMHQTYTEFVKGTGAGRDGRVPQVTFGVEYNADQEEITLTHETGDFIEADNLVVKHNQKTGEGSFRLLDEADTQFSDIYDVVTSNDSVTIEPENVREGDELIVQYVTSDTSPTLLRYGYGSKT